MSEIRPAVKLDFTSGFESLPERPKADGYTTQRSVKAGRELGFANRGEGTKIDGRKLRSRGPTVQLNLKVSPEEKETILRAANELIHDPDSRVTSIAEFVVHAVEVFKTRRG